MTAQITERVSRVDVPAVPQLAEQLAVAAAFAELVAMFGHLPKPYVSFPTSTPRISLQADGPAEFEAWRVALQVAPSDVEVVSYEGSAWLAVGAVFRGVAVELTGTGLFLSGGAVAA